MEKRFRSAVILRFNALGTIKNNIGITNHGLSWAYLTSSLLGFGVI